MLAGSNHDDVDRIPRTRPLAPLNPTPFEATPEYLSSLAATWHEEPSSAGGGGDPKQRIVAPMAVTALVVAIVGVCVAVVGHGSAKPVTNADLLKLVHSASDSLNNEPSNSFTLTETLSSHGASSTIKMSGVTSP